MLMACREVIAAELLVVTEEWPPFNYLSDDGNIVGTSTTFVTNVLRESNLKYSLEMVTWARAYNLALTRPNTLIYSIFQTEERAPLFIWFCPINRPVQISLFKLSTRDDVKINSLNDAKRYVLGVIRDDYASLYLQGKGFKVNKNLLESTDEKANIQQLFRERVDLTVQSSHSMYYRLMQLNLDRSSVVNVWPSIDETVQTPCMALSLNSDQAVVNALRAGFNRMAINSGSDD